MSKPKERTKGGAEKPLHERDCVGCESGAKKLGSEEIAAFAWRVEDWDVVKRHHLSREWTFEDFAQALAFVNKVGALAEKQGHHPDLFLKWGLVRAEISTHSVDGLTEDDFILAAKIDRLRA
jgi:4a-hydroxytetrahydrobiopterin dehydratase